MLLEQFGKLHSRLHCRMAATTQRESTFREASQVHEGWDHEELLAALREAIQARQAVPSWFVEAATNAYAWHKHRR